MQFMKEEVHMILKMKSVAKNNIIGEEQIKDWEVQDLCHPEVATEAEAEGGEQTEEVTKIPHTKKSTAIILNARRILSP